MRVPVALQESIPIAIGALRANKARSALTTLGIIIGIVAVVLTMTAANGLQNKFRESFSSVGTDILYVSRMPWVVMNDFFRYRNRPGIALREARALEDRFRGKAIVNPTVNGQRDVKYRDQTMESVIIIGIVAVVLTMTAANGLQNKFRESFSSVGTDIIYVSRMPWVVMNDFFRYRNRPGIALREARALEDRFRGRAIVNPTVNGQRDVKCRDQTMESVIIIGTTEKQSVMSDAVPQTGRFLLPFDVAYNRDVCVIGSEVQKGLFGAVNPINKEMKIGRTTFRVIGVMEKQGGSFLGGPNFDRQIFVPITSYMRAFSAGHRQEDVNIAVKAPRQEALSDLEYAVIGEMRTIRRLRPMATDNFSINKLDSLVGTFNNMMGVLLLVGLVVTSISLFVGAVGVMNIMFVTVTERTREIGIRKAIGATRRSILLQFLCESSVIGLLGGAIGIVLAVILTAVINAVLMPAAVSWPIVAVAVGVSAGVGVLAGVAPAYRGAKLDPIEALRYE